MELKGSLEENVLTVVCTSDQHAPGLLLALTPKLFSTRHYRKIAEIAFAHIEKYGRAPGVHLRDIMEADLRRGEEGQLLERILDDIYKLAEHLQIEYVLSQIAHFVTLRKLAAVVEEAADAVAAGDAEGAQRALYSQDLAKPSSPGIWLHDPDEMLRFMNARDEDHFTSGVETLDIRGVRPARKEIFFFLGNKKIGKSWALIQVAKNNMLSRKSVLHITLENSEEITAARYVQAMFAMTRDGEKAVRVPMFKKDSLGRCSTIDYDTLDPEHLRIEIKSQVAKRLRAFKGRPRLKIKEFPTSNLTIAGLNAYLDHLDRTENFRPDLLVLDYAKLMAFDMKNYRISIGNTIEQLRGVAVARNMAIVSAWQGNRDTDQARTVTAGNISEDYSLAGTVDTLVTISRTSQERSIGLARLLVDAARNSKDKWMAMISQSYATGQFCLDSVYMNRYVEDEVKRMSGEEDAE